MQNTIKNFVWIVWMAFLIGSLLVDQTVTAQAEKTSPVIPTPAQIPPLPPQLPEGIPAFPGAWGGGMFTTGGRGGRVIEVTNLNDSGPGSFREAVQAQGPRIVVFRVAGIIKLQSDLIIDSPDVTIAGQSAPGDGICLANYSLEINTSNVILRHLRSRRGRRKWEQSSDSIGGNPSKHIIIDHCSASWALDENLSIYRYMKSMPDGSSVKLPVKNVTIQYCISSEAICIGTHAFGGTWGGEDSTFHHNLFACNTGRSPSIGMSGEFDYRNNVVFNWGHRTIDGGDETSLVNIINNYFKPGPAASDNMVSTFARVEERDMYSPGRRWKAGNWYPPMGKRPGKWYVAGNIMDGFIEVTKDNWKGMLSQDHGQAPETARVNTPFEAWPVNQETAEDTFNTVLAKAGATLPRRDAVDRRVIDMVRNNKFITKNGIVNDPNEVGGYPDYSFSPEEVLVDTDHDGMPDEWEAKYELNPALADDGRLDSDDDGYTNVEEYLNGTNPREKIDYTNLGNNIDLIS